MQLISLDKIADSPLQGVLRAKGLDWNHIVALARSIKAGADANPDDPQVGLLQPIRVRQSGAGYEVRGGHHRLAAFALLFEGDGGEIVDDGGWPEFPGDTRFDAIPAYVEAASDAALLDEAAVEMFLSKGHSPVEQANVLAMMLETRTNAQVAALTGLSPSAVSNKVRLLKLPARVLELIARGDLTERHGRAMIWLAENLPFTLETFINQSGVGLWFWDGSVLTVSETEHNAHLAALRNTQILDWYYPPKDFWRSPDWEPWADPAFAAADLIPHEDALRTGTCVDCPMIVKYRSDERCKDADCYEARRALWRLRIERDPDGERARLNQLTREINAGAEQALAEEQEAMRVEAEQEPETASTLHPCAGDDWDIAPDGTLVLAPVVEPEPGDNGAAGPAVEAGNSAKTFVVTFGGDVMSVVAVGIEAMPAKRYALKLAHRFIAEHFNDLDDGYTVEVDKLIEETFA